MQNKNTTRNIQIANQCRRTRTNTDQQLLPSNCPCSFPLLFNITPERPEGLMNQFASIIFPIVSKAIFVRRKRLR